MLPRTTVALRRTPSGITHVTQTKKINLEKSLADLEKLVEETIRAARPEGRQVERPRLAIRQLRNRTQRWHRRVQAW